MMLRAVLIQDDPYHSVKQKSRPVRVGSDASGVESCVTSTRGTRLCEEGWSHFAASASTGGFGATGTGAASTGGVTGPGSAWGVCGIAGAAHEAGCGAQQVGFGAQQVGAGRHATVQQTGAG